MRVNALPVPHPKPTTGGAIPPAQAKTRSEAFGMGFNIYLTKILHVKFLCLLLLRESGPRSGDKAPVRGPAKRGSLRYLYSNGMPSLVDQCITQVCRLPCLCLAGVRFNPSHSTPAKDVPHCVVLLSCCCIHYNTESLCCQALCVLSLC